MKMPWKKRSDVQEIALKKIAEKQAELEKLKAARRGMQKMLSDLLETKKEAGNGNH